MGLSRMAPGWRWLFAAVAAMTLCLFAPGSMLSQSPTGSVAPSIEPVALDPGAAGCTAAACNRGAPAATGAVPAVAAIGVLVVAGVALALTRTWRRTRVATFLLPTGSPLTLFHPPQLALAA